MSRTETAHSLTVSSVDKRVSNWGQQLAKLTEMQGDISSQLESLALQRAATADDMAKALMPVAESMARLTEETRQTLAGVVSQSKQGHKEAVAAVQSSTKAAQAAASEVSTSMLRVSVQIDRMEQLTQDTRNNQPVSPWGPAILSALMPTLAVLWLAWKFGALKL